MSLRFRLAPVLLALATGCGKTNGSSPPRPAGTGTTATTDQSAARETNSCDDATCLTERSSKEREAGRLDVATRYLEQAYEADPTEARFERWISSLKDTGQHRRLSRALRDHAAQHPQAVDRHAADPGPDASVAPPAPSEAIASAHELQRKGDVERAAFALEQVDHPAWLARKGEVLLEQGESRRAAEAFARSRIALDERGAAMRLVPFDTSISSGVAWMDDHAVRIVGWRPLNYSEQVSVTALEHLAPGDRFDLTQRLLVRSSLHRVAGSELYGISDGGSGDRQSGDSRFEVHDLGTGALLGSVPAAFGDRGGTRLIAQGERRYLAQTSGQAVTIWRVDDKRPVAERRALGTFSIKGTTPTITRVYTGEGSYHHNILRDEPSWPVTYAISEDDRRVAIGVSDSSVQLFDVKSKKRTVLTVPWEYEERRTMGANPDHNRPVALAFDEDSLTAAFSRGDIVVWSRSGRKLAHRKGACSKSDLEALEKRYGEPMPLTDGDREGCAYIERAWLSPSGTRLATTGSFDLRVVDTKTGRSLVAHTGQNLGAESLAWASDRDLVFGNLYGQVWQWQEGQAVVSKTEKRDGLSGGPRRARLSSDLRVLTWGGDYQAIVGWDLFSGAALTADGAEAVNPGGLQASLTMRYGIARATDGNTVEDAAGTKVYPFDQGVADRIVFVDESGRFLMTRRGKTTSFVDLEERREQAIDVPVDGNTSSELNYRASADGSRVAILGDDLTIRVFETRGGSRIASATVELVAEDRYRGEFALAPDGSWIAWQAQLEQPRNSLPEARVHLVGIDRGVRSRTFTVTGWADILAPSPSGDELLVATENTLTRFDVRTGKTVDEGFEYVGVNSMHFDATGKLVLFEKYNLVELRANRPGLPLLATVYALDNGGWFLQTVNGAVDGSTNATQSLATLVDGPLDSTVLGGAVGWDRFAVPHLLARPRGYEAAPPGVD